MDDVTKKIQDSLTHYIRARMRSGRGKREIERELMKMAEETLATEIFRSLAQEHAS